MRRKIALTIWHQTVQNNCVSMLIFCAVERFPIPNRLSAFGTLTGPIASSAFTPILAPAVTCQTRRLWVHGVYTGNNDVQ